MISNKNIFGIYATSLHPKQRRCEKASNNKNGERYQRRGIHREREREREWGESREKKEMRDI